MPGELNKVRDKSYSKGKEKKNGTFSSKKKSWTQKRTHTTIILLKISVDHGILILIEVHPLEKNLFDSKKNGAKKPRNKSYSKGKGKVMFEKVHQKNWTQ